MKRRSSFSIFAMNEPIFWLRTSDDTTVVLLEEAKPEEVQSVVVAGLRAAAMPSDALERCSEAMGDALAAVG